MTKPFIKPLSLRGKFGMIIAVPLMLIGAILLWILDFIRWILRRFASFLGVTEASKYLSAKLGYMVGEQKFINSLNKEDRKTLMGK